MSSNNPQNSAEVVAPTHCALAEWNLPNMVISEEQFAIARELKLWLTASTNPLANSIAQSTGGKFETELMRLLEQQIISSFSPLPNAARYLLVLCKVVDSINQTTAAPLPLPRIPNIAVRPKNPFREDLTSSLALARVWRESISLKRMIPPDSKSGLSSQANQGRLFLSAVIHGGLCSPDLLVALARALNEPSRSTLWIQKKILIELSISWQGEVGSEHRFWFADPLTATLIVRQIDTSQLHELPSAPSEMPDGMIRKQIWESISAFLRTSGVIKSQRPQSLGELTRKAKIDLQTRLPQVLANYAGRSLVCHSPSKQVLSRIHGIQCPADEPLLQNHTPESKEQVSSFNSSVDNLDSLEPEWLNVLRSSFSEKSEQLIVSKISNVLSGWSHDSIGYCFALFARHLITGRSAGGNKLALPTARAYLVSVCKRLGGRLGDTDPRTLDSESLENLYIEILEDADSDSGVRKQRRKIARSLREFHHFLVQHFDAAPINDKEILGIGKGLVPVDANLITFDEYDRILFHLPKSVRAIRRNLPAQDKLVATARLILMLSFKCGLRRMEVLKLKLGDVCEHDPAELLVRPSDARRLKTKSSTRKMPLYALLTNGELDELISWKQSRLKELSTRTAGAQHTRSQDAFLFGIPELAFDCIPQDTIFPILHDAMREVTGDKLLRFHHLRHSFGSWLFLRLMLSDLPCIPNLFPNLPKTTEYLNESIKFRNRLYGRADHTRRHTYAVAALLGHSGPEISLEHYVHFCDHLFAEWMLIDKSAPSKQSMISNSASPKSTIYRWLSHGPTNVSHRIAKKQRLLPDQFSNKIRPKKITEAHPSSTSASIIDTPEIFDLAWDILHRYALNRTPVDELSRSTGIHSGAIRSFIQKAEEIAAMKTEKGKGGFRHRMISATLSREVSTSNTRLACPIGISTDSDKNLVCRLAPRMIEAFDQSPQLCATVFDYYLKNAWNTRNELIFKDPDEPEYAKQFLQFLKALGLKSNEVNFVSFDNSKRSRPLAKWKSQLGISWRISISKSRPPNKQNALSANWLGIKPVFKLGQKHRSNVDETPQGSIAFRYLMIMGAIVFPEWRESMRQLSLNAF